MSHVKNRKTPLILILLALVLGPSAGLVSGPSISAAASYALLYSTSSNRSNAAPLDGQNVSGNIYAFTALDTTDIARVRFYLDNPTMIGSPRRSEGSAPYDFAGGSVSKATRFDTTMIPDGSHTITAAIDLVDGSTVVVNATFFAGEIPGGNGTLRFDTPSLEFASPLNGAASSQTVNLSSDTGDSTAYSIADNVSWATIDPSSGITPSVITVSVDPTGLPAGIYRGTVTATATNHTAATLPIVLSIAGADLDQIHLAWVDDPSTTLTVIWRTQHTTDPSVVEYRELGSATWLTATGSLRPSGTTGTLHEVTLTSLTPATAYEYRISALGDTWTPTYQTRTAPPQGPADFDAIYVADTGIIGRTDGLATGTRQVIDEIASLNPLVVLPGGDYAYYNTDDRFGTLDNTIDAWFNQMQPIASQSPLMPTYGNHEVLLGENYDSWAARFPTPTGFDGRRNYSFDIGDVHFVSIFAVKNDGGLPFATREWIIQDIQAAKNAGQRWIIPYLHVSPFSEGTNHPSDLSLRSELGPIFESFGVQVVIASHDQSYERTYPLTDVPATNTPTSLSTTCYTLDDGVTWVKVSPGGKLSNLSKDFSPWNSEIPPAWTAFRDNTMHHFLRVRVSAEGTLRVEAFGVAGDGTAPVIQDSFYYTDGSCPPPEPGDVTPPTAPNTLVATGTTNGVSLNWDDNLEADLSGYHVYRSDTLDGAYIKITGTPVRPSAYVDTSATVGDTFFYRVTAIDTNGNESDASNEASGERLEPGFELVYSLAPRRTSPVALLNASVSGSIYIFTTPDTTDIVRVRFYLDNPTLAGSPRRMEDSAPYDFAGGTATKAKAFDTRTIGDGTHTVTAAVDLADGTTQLVHAAFTVVN